MSSIEHPAVPPVPLFELPSSPLRLPLAKDEALRRYIDWQKARVSSEGWRRRYEEAFNELDKECISLTQLRKHENMQWLMDRGVAKGIAENLVKEVILWKKEFNAEAD